MTDKMNPATSSNDAKNSISQPDKTPEKAKPDASKEVGGRKGPDPTRFGDWEKNGRCIDF